MYSLIETCILCGVDPEEYLRYIARVSLREPGVVPRPADSPAGGHRRLWRVSRRPEADDSPGIQPLGRPSDARRLTEFCIRHHHPMMSNDASRLVASFKHMLRGTLHRIHRWGFDGLMEEFLELSDVSLPEGGEVADLPVMARFEIYRTIWNAAIEACYDRYVPEKKEYMAPSYAPEITAYTVTLCSLLPIEDRDAEIRAILRNEPEAEFDITALTTTVAESDLPAAVEDRRFLYLRLLNFPPLRELWKLHFFLYFEEEELAGILAETFKTPVRATHVSYTAPEALTLSTFPLPQEFFEANPAERLASNPQLARFRDSLLKISAESSPQEIEFHTPLILSECGHPVTNATKPRSAIEHDAVFRDFDLGCAVGLAYLGNARTHILQRWSRSLHEGIAELNDVKHPDCLLLVEGDSEENLLPLLAARLALSLRSARVRVHNSGSKQKLKDDFFKFRKSTPDLPMVVLLDHDAEQESVDIARAIEGEHGKYLVVRLQRGELEDELPLAASVAVLNRMYPDGGVIEEADFPASKPFVKSAKRVLWEKKHADFDKPKFASMMALAIERDSVPESLLTVINGARLRATAMASSRR